ncbi:hypothetical protein EV193_11944 [Herbihabitans rhizosphaerae]|uniref:Uncharacterized protein n=1 Tax=Herbihabitans rhizosphaerae TaxID=1872711 RepID=A0A4V2ER92_9PSEU|nr:hypothetical protein [Herbihabitans rhizosphaerae]RZS29641.1 hypothetical protein EV193_11944 [Herbihabitans rhizosphaerae]
MDPIQRLRMTAIEERLGDRIDSDQLIQAARGTLRAGIVSLAAIELAGLGRGEAPQAHDLFARVLEELDLASTLPADPTAARWELIRWWCQLIIDGHVAPEVGGRLVWCEGFDRLDGPDALRPLVALVSELDDWREDWGVPRDTYRRRVIDAAKQVLEQPCPSGHREEGQ